MPDAITDEKAENFMKGEKRSLEQEIPMKLLSHVGYLT